MVGGNDVQGNGDRQRHLKVDHTEIHDGVKITPNRAYSKAIAVW
jgi:hypothetical protein